MGMNELPGKVLYIEDNNESKMLITRILEAEGCHVIFCSDGIRGLELVDAVDPDLVLVDLNLPFMDGYETATRLKTTVFRRRRPVPVIATSIHTSFEDRDMAMAAGCDGFIAKPIDVDAFADLIRRYYAGHRDTIPPKRERDALIHYHQRLVRKLEARAAAVMLEENTNFYNQQFLFKRLEEESSRSLRVGEPYSLVYILVEIAMSPDREDRENERKSVLRNMADIIRSNKRIFDVAAKMNNDAFCLVLTGCSQECAHAAAERICGFLHERMVNLLPKSTNLMLSFGVSTGLGDSAGPTLLLETARQHVTSFRGLITAP